MRTVKPSTSDRLSGRPGDIESIEFVRSVYSVDEVPGGRFPVLAFAGRSNVGKSTWINALARRDVARVSRTPGKTQCLNYFLVNQRKYWVDLPGYGYARVSRSRRHSWKGLIEEWFHRKVDELLVLMIVDSSIPIQSSDTAMAEWFVHAQIPFAILANKSDRLRSSERTRIVETFRSCREFSHAIAVEAVSARKKEGRHLVLEILKERGLI